MYAGTQKLETEEENARLFSSQTAILDKVYIVLLPNSTAWFPQLFATLCLFASSVCAKWASTRGLPHRISEYEISKSTGFQVNFGF